MPSEVYEVVAQGARYWFLFLMVLIVWRSYRWYRRDLKQRKKRLRLLPDAGFVGDMVVLKGGGGLERGDVLTVPREGTLGSLRTNDLCIPAEGVAKRHLWFRFDDGKGLMVEPFRTKQINVDGVDFVSRRQSLYMAHGSRLYVGEAELRLRMFAGFEAPVHSRLQMKQQDEQASEEPQQEGAQSQAQMQQLWMQQMMMAQQAAYQQWMAEQYARMAAGQGPANGTPEDDMSEDDMPDDDMPQEAETHGEARLGLSDTLSSQDGDEPESAYYEMGFAPDFAPQGNQTVFETDEHFYPPLSDESDTDAWPYAPYPQPDVRVEPSGYTYPEYLEPDELDEDMTDAAAPPKSAYIGHDEAEAAKKKLWDKYLGGGHAR